MNLVDASLIIVLAILQSSSTMIGLLPPNSSTVGVKCLAAA